MGEIAQREAPITQQEKRGGEAWRSARGDDTTRGGISGQASEEERECVREEREGRQTGNESEKDEGLSRQKPVAIAAELPMLYLLQRPNKMGQPQSTRVY